MKQFFSLLLVGLLLLITAGRVMAQTPSPDPTDQNGPSDIKLTPSGTAFANGSADGQCTVSGATCTTSTSAPGICTDNGLGAGVCTTVTPSGDPLFDTGCGPTEICHIAPEKIARELKGSQSETKGWGSTDPLGLLWDFTQIWDGIVKPGGVYHYGTDLLTKFGNQIQNSSFLDLTPASLQALTLHDVQPKRFCVTSRLCVYNPETGDLEFNFLTNETYCTVDPPARKELIEGTRRLASYTTNYVIGTDYRLPNTVVKKVAALGCSAKLDDGRVMDENSIQFTKQNEYIDAITHWTDVHVLESWISRMVNPDTGRITYSTHESTQALEKGSAENSMAASLAGISFSVTMDDLKPFSYPSDPAKLALTQVGGLWNTYRNDAFDVEFKSPTDAIYDPQAWYVGIKGSWPDEAPTLQSMNARQENAQLFGNCSILNTDDPKYKNLGCDKMNWLATGTPNPTPAPTINPYPPGVPNTSTWASTSNGSSGTNGPAVSSAFSVSPIASKLVPSCVLEGVAKIEGAYDGGAPCKPNECGAYGPFQITIGNCKNCGASSCPNAAKALGVTKDQLCDFDSAAYQASRLLVGKAKYFGLSLTTADPKTQKLAIIIAGDSYYGTTSPIPRLGGLSYGEWVYQHCDPTYTTHIDHNFPPPGGFTAK